MRVFICRWQHGDLSIVGARNADEAVLILAEFGDATDAELFETKNLLIDFRLNDSGDLELEQFGQDLDTLIWQRAYPLIFQATTNNDPAVETDFLKVVEAEQVRLWPNEEFRETEHFARNLFVTRVASDRNVSLANALKIIKTENLTVNESWHTLAVKCQVFNTVQFANHIQSLLEPSEDGPDLSLRMSSVPEEELSPYDENDLLPHFLLAAVVAEHARTTILMGWSHARHYVKEEIGTYWRWLAQTVRTLPISD